MAELRVFHCCAQSPVEPGAPGPAFFTAPIGRAPAFEMVGAQIENLSFRSGIDRRVAIHEAGHAAVHTALGNRVARVTIIGQPQVTFAGKFCQRLATIGTLAGDAATAWMRSEIDRVPDDELARWVPGIRDACGGGCDRCKAIRNCIVGTRHAPDPVVIATFRQLETLAGFIVRMPVVWSAISEIADALMARGTVSGRAVKSICRRHFEPGFLFDRMSGEHHA